MTSHPRPRYREDFQIAVICALPLEYDAAALAFDEFWDEDGDKFGRASGDYNIYKTGRIGSHNVVLVLLPNMGKASAASTAASLRSSYAGLRLAVLTGICGGVPSPGTDNEILLGDVVISKSIVQYDLGRQYPDKFTRKDTVDDNLGRPSKDVRSLLATFQTHLGINGLRCRITQILTQIQQKAVEKGYRTLYNRPTAAEDRLFEPGYLHRHRDRAGCGCSESGACETGHNASCEELQCDVGHLVSRKRLETKTKLEQEGDATKAQELQVFVGRVGSGDTVMKSGEHRDRIAREHHIIAFEMEGAGVWDEIPCIIVKAVCDYADSHKNKKWQDFAAATAASAAKALLERYALTNKPTTTNGRRDAASYRGSTRSSGALWLGRCRIALAYVYWLQEVCPEVSVFWVHASNSERFRQSYTSIAQRCRITGHDDPKTSVLPLVKTWLQEECRRWLMVVDSADDTELFFGQSDNASGNDATLVQFLPECSHGALLVTTRNKQTGVKLTKGTNLIEVGRMTEEECQDLLRQRLGDISPPSDDLSTLSKRLECLPLALAQAAAFIQENSITVQEYLDLQGESDQSLIDLLSEEFETVGRDSETPRAVAQTWMLSFQQIQRQHALAGRLLSFMSLLDYQGVPKEFLSHYSGCSKFELVKALGILKAFSLVVEEKGSSFDMHRLVHLVTRKWLAKQGTTDEFRQDALLTVSEMFPWGGDFENKMTCSAYLPHANAVLQLEDGGLEVWEEAAKASLLDNMAGYLVSEGNGKDAEKMFKIAMEIKKRICGEEHPSTLTSMSNVVSAYMAQGQWEEAEKLSVQVIEMSKTKLGADDPSILPSMGNLASTFCNQGRWEEADKLCVQVMEMSKTKLGADHPGTLTSMNNLMWTYISQGRWEEAEKLGVQVMEISKTKLGADHLETLTNMGNLASTYTKQGRWEEAEKLGVQVIETWKTRFGPDHPDTLTSISNLASTYWNQGRWEEAEKLFKQVIKSCKTKLGEDHPYTLTSMDNLASTYWKQVRWEEAEKLSVQVIESFKTKLGAEHPDTLTSMVNLLSSYMELDRWEKAEKLGVQIMETRKTKLGVDHPETQTSMDNLAEIFWNQGRWEEAEKLAVQVMETRKTKLGADHLETLTSLSKLASTYWKQGRWEEAEKLKVQVLETRKTKLGADHPETLLSTVSLAHVWQDMGKSSEATDLMRSCTRESVEGSEEPIPSSRHERIGHVSSNTAWPDPKTRNVVPDQGPPAGVCDPKSGPAQAPQPGLSLSQPELWAPQPWLSTSSALETEMDFGELEFRVRVSGYQAILGENLRGYDMLVLKRL
ncbi:hypothetical protein DL767_000989 [Monosporascus sp. MG133]|nr:hypothetical protein DL767_000989 [Monosporascus sp. MG133]